MTEITQADRDAAVALALSDGWPDLDLLVYAFARHRIAALSAPREPSEAMIEAGAWAAFEVFSGARFTFGKPWEGQSTLLQQSFRDEARAAYRAMIAAKETE